MTKHLTLLLAILVSDCYNKPATVEQAIPTTTIDTPTSDPSTAQVDTFFNNPIRDMNNFSVKIGNDFLDSLNEQFTNNKQVKSTIKTDLCGGDCCTSFKTMTAGNEKAAFYFFKGDCGEYGFSNDQFFVVNGNLTTARNFIVGIEESDSTGTVWSIEEKLYLFDKTTVTIKERKKLKKGLMDFEFTLGNTPFTSKTTDKADLSKTKMDELTKLLATENVNDD